MRPLFIKMLAALAVTLAVSGCATAPQLRATDTPTAPLVLETALVGHLRGDGTVTTLFGDKTHFAVTIEGRWDGAELTLVEDFRYDDGKTERKTWHLSKTAPGQYRGTREDVIGAASVRQDGGSVRLDYEVMLDTGLGRIRTRFRDILFLEQPGTVRNRAVVSKFGLRIATVDLLLARSP
jgi:hypothetical protein